MKNWSLLGLVLAGLAAGILFLWFEDSPSPEPANKGSAEQRSQLEPEASRQPFGPDERHAAAQIAARDSDAAAAQANRSAAADVSASKLLRPARVDRAAWDLPDDDESEEFVIGGHVQDEDGNPLSSIEVLAERIDHSDSAAMVYEDVPSIFSDFDGTFLFGNLEDGEYRVRIAPVEGIAPVEARVRAGTLNVSLVVVVLRNVRIYGTVNRTDGEPIKDVNIIAEPTTRITSTGARGEYELDISWRGSNVVHTIFFQHEGFRQQRIRISPADLNDLIGDFQLDVSMAPLKRLTTVTGRLTDTKGNPVGGEKLDIVTSQLRTWYHAQSDVRGNFLFKEVEPGEDHQLRIRPVSRYKNKDINPLVVPDGGLNLDIVLELIDEGELSGWMIDLDGNPIPGFSLTLRSTTATAQSVSVVGDQQGFFSVEDFPVGGAHFRTNSYPVLLVRGIRVSPEPEEPITVILDTGLHVLQGRVINLFGDPVAASSITLGWEFSYNGLQNSSTRKTTANQNGNFVFTGLGPGLHAMQVSAAGFSTAVHTIDVGTDPNEIVVELEEETQ
jgi:hypothetical protein